MQSTEKKKYLIMELNLMEIVLLDLFKIKGTGLSFMINKNLIILDSIKISFLKALKSLDEKFCLKKDGKVLYFEVEPDELGNPVFKKDADGNLIEIPISKGSCMCFVEEEYKEEYQAEILKIKNEEHDVNFFTIQECEIESLCKQNIIDGFDFKPLMGSIIV